MMDLAALDWEPPAPVHPLAADEWLWDVLERFEATNSIGILCDDDPHEPCTASPSPSATSTATSRGTEPFAMESLPWQPKPKTRDPRAKPLRSSERSNPTFAFREAE